MGGARRFLVVASLLTLCGCASFDAYGVVGDPGEVFTGHMSGSGGQGKLDLDNGKGTRCLGDYTSSRPGENLPGLIGTIVKISSSASGRVLLSCTDGQQAIIQFTSLNGGSGYGFGTTNRGQPVKFAYGMSRDESARYLNGQSAAAPGSTPGAAPPQAAATTTGTGFFITRQGQLLTNAHVVEDCKSVSVTPLGGAAQPASVVSSDRTNDLAVLATGSAPRAVAALRGQPVRQGDAVVAYGFPLTGALSSDGVTTSGSISALAGLRDDSRFLQMSAPVQPGNSGGPLLDMTGAVVGVVSSRLAGRSGQAAQNVNFAIKTEVIRTYLAAVGIAPETSTGGRELSTPDVVERARAFTVFVECRR